MEGNVFHIKTPVFEGPLELLLTLIEKRKLFVSDVSLAQVTDDYIEYIKSVEHFPMSQAAQFILVASTLLLLKSKALLPTIALTEEEEESIHDLEQRLKLYKYFQELSKKIGAIFGVSIIFPKTHTKIIEPTFSPPKDLSSFTLHATMQDVIDRLPKKKQTPNVSVKKVVSLSETIQSLTSRMQKSLKMSFKEFAQHEKAEKVDVIVGFLAMLELVKQGIIIVNQKMHFDDIEMEHNRPGLPQY